METKRGIDYTQIVALWMILCSLTFSYQDLNQRLSHIWHGTDSTVQPTIVWYALAEREKGEEAKRPTDRNDGIITFCIMFAKYIKSRAERYAQISGCLLALTCSFSLPPHSGIKY